MVQVDTKKCIGCGLCVSICPSSFRMEGSKAKAKAQKQDKCVDEAITSCPVSAISK
jgi:ferredoxin